MKCALGQKKCINKIIIIIIVILAFIPDHLFLASPAGRGTSAFPSSFITTWRHNHHRVKPQGTKTSISHSFARKGVQRCWTSWPAKEHVPPLSSTRMALHSDAYKTVNKRLLLWFSEKLDRSIIQALLLLLLTHSFTFVPLTNCASCTGADIHQQQPPNHNYPHFNCGCCLLAKLPHLGYHSF